eukprot:74824_1
MNWIRCDVICMVEGLLQGSLHRRRPCKAFFCSINHKSHLFEAVPSSFKGSLEKQPTKANSDKSDDIVVPCVAYHASRTIDYLRLFHKLYAGATHRRYPDCIVISGPFPPLPSVSLYNKKVRASPSMLNWKPVGHGGISLSWWKGSAATLLEEQPWRIANPKPKPQPVHSTDDRAPQSIVLFSYGSVVFFNLPAEEREAHLKAIKGSLSTPFIEREQHIEEHLVVVRKSFKGTGGLESDRVVVKDLSPNLLAVIGGVMAQSVALDHYQQEGDKMLDIFTLMNSSVERTGVFTAMEKKNLFMLIAQNITVTINIIKKLRLFEKNETAWKDAELHQIWEGLREEFELESRFKNLEFVLQLIQHNTKFFLEILHNQKSDKLEWIIIILISLEICVSLTDMFRPYG